MRAFFDRKRIFGEYWDLVKKNKMAADCDEAEAAVKNLSDVGKYSYASLCSIILSNLFETPTDR